MGQLTLADRKRQWVYQQKTEAQRKRQRQRRCFWTRPFGHRYDTYYVPRKCVGCEKRGAG